MVSVAKNLTNIKLTESDTDGIFIHFEPSGGPVGGVLLKELLCHGDMVNGAIQAWAREQLDRQEVVEPGTRPSLPVDEGY